MFKFIEAKSVNDIVDPSTTLGIEITDKDVAACCRLGNLDGQHGTGQDWIPARYATARRDWAVQAQQIKPKRGGYATAI